MAVRTADTSVFAENLCEEEVLPCRTSSARPYNNSRKKKVCSPARFGGEHGLFHKLINCQTQIVNGIFISGGNRIHHAVAHVVF